MQWEILTPHQGFERCLRIRLCVAAHRILRWPVSDSARVGSPDVSESARRRIGFGADSGPGRWITGTERARPAVLDSALAAIAAGPRIELCVMSREGPARAASEGPERS